MTGNRSIFRTVSNSDRNYKSWNTACLQVMGFGPTCREFPLAERPLVIGRDQEQCDIFLDGVTISRKHARIEHLGRGKFQLTDLQSTNGIYLNNKKIDTFCLLSHNDVVGLGRSGMAHLRFRSLPCNQDFHADLLPPQSFWTIGRSPDCDICLPFLPTISAHHATVYARNGHVTLVDESSLNGTWINGRPLHRELSVGEQDVVVIGSTEFHFFLQKNGSLQIRRRQRAGNIFLKCRGLTCRPAFSGTAPPILNNIDLSFQPGEFIGLLGPSGAGKTTLLKALSGYAQPDSGTVLINEIPLYGSCGMFRSTLGYVPQDDILHPELSVEVSLDYIARLRLPHDVDIRQRRDIVNSILDVLDLDRVRNSRIDRLSGGQRKRVSIGAELITRPGLLFLDEPSSGLDPGMEEKLMHHFRTMAKAGTTVVVTTHTLENIALLDKIVLLARGELIFFGTPNEAIRYFQQFQGNICRPADIFRVLEKRRDKTNGAEKHGETDRHTIAVQYADQYKNSPYFKKYIGGDDFSVEQDLSATLQHPKTAIFDNQLSIRYDNFLKKLPQPIFSFPDWLTLSRRHISIRFASPKRIMIYALIPMFLALVTLTQNIEGFIDKETDKIRRQTLELQVRSGGPVLEASLKTLLSPEGMKDPRKAWEIIHAVRYQGPANLPVPMGVLLMGIMTAGFLGTVAGCLEISSERLIYQRERMSGMRIADYLGSKLPFCLSVTAVQCLLFIGCCSFHPSLNQIPFFPIWLTMVGVAWASVCMGLLISAIDPSSGRFSVLFSVAVVLPQIILSGGLGPDFYSGMADPARISAALLPVRWGLEMGLTAVYDGTQESAALWMPYFVQRVIGFDYGSRVYYHGASVLAVQAVFWLLLCAWLLKRRDPI